MGAGRPIVGSGRGPLRAAGGGERAAGGGTSNPFADTERPLENARVSPSAALTCGASVWRSTGRVMLKTSELMAEAACWVSSEGECGARRFHRGGPLHDAFRPHAPAL